MRRSAVLLVAWLGLAACEDTPVTSARAPRPRRQEPVAVRPDAASQPVDNYVYSSIGKRDPFRPYHIDQALEEQARDAQKTRSDLEKLELAQLRLVGIVSGTSTPTAMFEDPDGRGHVVRVGTPMGRNGGKVAKIKRDEVVIIEEFRDPVTNKRVQSPISVRLPTDEMPLE